MSIPDWNQLRAFYATAVHGSLSSAAREIGLTQPTLSRQIMALESSLGVTLFERVGKRLVLTETGHGLLEHARVMGEAALATRVSATGHSEAVGGRVSISATDSYAAYMLPDILARVRRDAPQVTIVVISSNKLSDLRRREADIALRHVRPDEPDLIGRMIRTSKAGFYASRGWVERHGMPQKPGDIAADLIGFDDVAQFAAYMRGVGIPVEGHDLRLISESTVVVWELVRRGLGVGAMLAEIAARTPDVVNVLPDMPPIEVPLWLVTHRELRTSRRIRLVYDLLAEELSRLEA
ncbi:LysR family transcriptional regulator [Asticcacaulis sp. AC402]|uniref:LysR family transcriptional regulator n=1 Tax=Asticcacaulis sp. AC402 TaxID=1282361 RepID=UPI0003C3E831|nr:LysR family transcriptional regulator [Asticcacaulis sp. AC402]ESQ76023.1 LysR family transcriptional regulator [Asticcacaulis sp. AC402]